MKRRHFLNQAAIAGALLGLAPFAQAAEWPTGPIKLIVGYAVGGPADILARALAKEMAERLGVPVIVESKVGGGGVVATDFIIGSKDGHTFLFNSTGGFSVKPHVTKLRHDPWRDVKPITVVTSAPYIFVARAGINVKTMSELTAYGKSNLAKLNMAVAGLGTINHLLSGMYLNQSGVQAALVPFTGAAPAITSLLSGDTDIMVVDPGAVLPFIKERKLVPLAVTDSVRLPFMPEVPTTAEAGFPGVEGTALWSLFAPWNTPDAVVQKLRQAVISAGSSDAYRKTVDARLMIQRTTTPEQLTQLMRTEEVRYKKAIEQLDIKMQ